MNSKLEIARKLAEITGKPITEFFDGEIDETKSGQHDCITDATVHDTTTVKDNNTGISEEDVRQNKKDIEKDTRPTVSGQLLEYQKMFEGSKIVNKTIIGGRVMTRKEYLKITRGMTRQQYLNHPLVYKIFRAEGQVDASFMTFPNRFEDEY